jgi:hypothetical protein
LRFVRTSAQIKVSQGRQLREQWRILEGKYIPATTRSLMSAWQPASPSSGTFQRWRRAVHGSGAAAPQVGLQATMHGTLGLKPVAKWALRLREEREMGYLV